MNQYFQYRHLLSLFLSLSRYDDNLFWKENGEGEEKEEEEKQNVEEGKQNVEDDEGETDRDFQKSLEVQDLCYRVLRSENEPVPSFALILAQ